MKCYRCDSITTIDGDTHHESGCQRVNPQPGGNIVNVLHRRVRVALADMRAAEAALAAHVGDRRQAGWSENWTPDWSDEYRKRCDALDFARRCFADAAARAIESGDITLDAGA
jgi:hypothetical protein